MSREFLRSRGDGRNESWRRIKIDYLSIFVKWSCHRIWIHAATSDDFIRRPPPGRKVSFLSVSSTSSPTGAKSIKNRAKDPNSVAYLKAPFHQHKSISFFYFERHVHRHNHSARHAFLLATEWRLLFLSRRFAVSACWTWLPWLGSRTDALCFWVQSMMHTSY